MKKLPIGLQNFGHIIQDGFLYVDLFKGLYIAEKTDYDWQSYPVFQFNFAKLAA